MSFSTFSAACHDEAPGTLALSNAVGIVNTFMEAQEVVTHCEICDEKLYGDTFMCCKAADSVSDLSHKGHTCCRRCAETEAYIELNRCKACLMVMKGLRSGTKGAGYPLQPPQLNTLATTMLRMIRDTETEVIVARDQHDAERRQEGPSRRAEAVEAARKRQQERDEQERLRKEEEVRLAVQAELSRKEEEAAAEREQQKKEEEAEREQRKKEEEAERERKEEEIRSTMQAERAEWEAKASQERARMEEEAAAERERLSSAQKAAEKEAAKAKKEAERRAKEAKEAMQARQAAEQEASRAQKKRKREVSEEELERRREQAKERRSALKKQKEDNERHAEAVYEYRDAYLTVMRIAAERIVMLGGDVEDFHARLEANIKLTHSEYYEGDDDEEDGLAVD